MFKDFVSIIHRIELFFSALLQEWNIWEDDSKKVNLLIYMTQRIEPFLIWLRSRKRVKTFLCDLTQRIEFFFSIWLWELYFFLYMSLFIEPYSNFDSKNWTFFFFSIFENFFNTINRFEPFSTGLKEFNWIPNFDSKNWTFSGIWLNGLNPLHKRTQRIGPSKIIWLQQPNFFITRGIERAFLFQSKNWAFFFSKISLKLLDFFFQNMTHRIELLLTTWHYSQNWTLFK